MAKQTVSIVGTGLSGLTLGRCLLKRGIPAVLYERTPSPPQHNYGITLHTSTYTPLLQGLDMDERAFKSRVAVDATIGGSGTINGTRSCFRANRGRLEELLREGLDIKWEHKLQCVTQGTCSTTLHFSHAHTVSSAIVIAADGPHSTLRHSVLPDSKLTILPFVAYNGKRSMRRAAFESVLGPHMQLSNIINFMCGDARVNISINDYTSHNVSVSWTYSRPARGSSDALHNPDRALEHATHVPDELFDELDRLQRHPLFDPDALRKDRILQWLQRTILIPREDLHALARNGVVLIGDAAHAQPIVGGNGANEAICDAVSLADCIADGGDDVGGWINARYPAWRESGDMARHAIGKMHGGMDSIEMGAWGNG